MDLSPLWAVLSSVGILAKEIGKGGGGSTEEPSVCMSLLPVGLGIGLIGVARVREALARRRAGSQAG
jgi:hypothetical protein